MIALLIAAALTASTTSADRRPVDVRTNGDDGLTQRLSEALIKRLDSASRIRAVTPDEDAELALVIIGNGTPGAKKFDYMVDLMKTNGDFAPERIASLNGKCRESALAECAAEIVAAADRKVKG